MADRGRYARSGWHHVRRAFDLEEAVLGLEAGDVDGKGKGGEVEALAQIAGEEA